MLVLLLILVSVGLLIHGMATNRPGEVLAAGGLSLVVVLVVIGERWLRSRSTIALAEVPAEDELGDIAAGKIDGADTDSAGVVFVAGRTVFHAPNCALIADRMVSRADRAELEQGGMTPCGRCLPDARKS